MRGSQFVNKGGCSSRPATKWRFLVWGGRFLEKTAQTAILDLMAVDKCIIYRLFGVFALSPTQGGRLLTALGRRNPPMGRVNISQLNSAQRVIIHGLTRPHP